MIQPMLAKVWSEHCSHVTYPVMVQPKLDGVRALWDGRTLLSRTGHSIECPCSVLSSLCKIALTCGPNLHLDGELFSKSMTFDAISGQVRRLDQGMSKSGEEIEYWVFDVVSSSPFSTRNIWLKEASNSLAMPGIVFLPASTAKSEAEVHAMAKLYIEEGFEGCMVRAMSEPYIHTRTLALLKLKKFLDEEGVVTGMQPGKGRHLGVLGALIVQGEGWKSEVGTGFTDFERRKFWECKDHVIGQTCTVRFQSKTSKGSLRFPSFVCLRSEE